jgi:hypothetical protein
MGVPLAIIRVHRIFILFLSSSYWGTMTLESPDIMSP